MKIHGDVLIKGAVGEETVKALIDTGAEVSMMPYLLAARIGAWRTNYRMTLISAFKKQKGFDLVAVNVYFPTLDNKGLQMNFALNTNGTELIIGMDILNPLGITIDTGAERGQAEN